MLEIEDYAFPFGLCVSMQIKLKIMLAHYINAQQVHLVEGLIVGASFAGFVLFILQLSLVLLFQYSHHQLVNGRNFPGDPSVIVRLPCWGML